MLQEYGGSEKLTFEDNVPVQIGGGTAPMAGAPASVNPSAGKYVQGCAEGFSVVVSCLFPLGETGGMIFPNCGAKATYQRSDLR